MTFFLGIDPGKSGAIALLHADTSSLDVWDMPGTIDELHDIIAGLPIVKRCTLEKLHAGPQMGRTSIAKMFENYGVIRGALSWRDIPVIEVPPKKWKPAMDLSKDKNASREMAMQRVPDDKDLFKRVKDDGRAEAALLALYGGGLAPNG